MKLRRHPDNQVFYITWQEAGRSHRRSTRTKKRAEAEAALREFIRQKDQGWTQSLTVSEAAARWLREREPDGLRPVSRHTFAEYRLTVDRLVRALGRRQAGEVRPREIRRALDKLRDEGLSLPTRAKWLRHIRMIFGELHREGEIRMNPALAVPSPKEEKRRGEAMPSDAFSRLLTAVEGQASSAPSRRKRRSLAGLGAALEVLWATGLRSVELIRLEWADIDLDRATWTIRSPKNKGGVSERPIPARVVEILRRREDEHGGPFGPGLRIAWARWKRENPEWAGVSLHSLRHAFVTRLARTGHAQAASFLVGHHSEAMTRHYTHLTAEDVREVVEGAS
jgi:integrase